MKSNLENLHVQNKTVLVRFDGNIPINHGRILNDQRLLASLPTIQMLLDKGATVILLTHMGRPQYKDPSLSTRQLISWFNDYGLHIVFAQNPSDIVQKKKEGNKLILMENVRFFPGETNNDPEFAKELAALGDFYINDAFGSLARQDTSLTMVPNYFDNTHKTIGLLVEHELAMLDNLKKRVQKPLVLIIGGNKMSDKIPFLSKAMPHLSTILIGPALVFTFLKALGKPIGNSLIDNDAINMCKDVIMHAEEHGVKICYPIDYIIAEGSFDGPLDITTTDTISSGDVGMCIGPKTALAWSKIISQAKSVIMNGLMGSLSRAESLVYTKDIFHAMAQTDALTIIAGGDSVAAAYYFDVAKDIDYISTGGSATLYYLHDIPLPALDALKISDKS
jgi:phosphoglycerate kinase